MSNFTRNAIISSFLKLLDQRPLAKITIKDIVEDCGINRNSFYYHFRDIPALLGEIVGEEINRIISQYPTIDTLEAGIKIAVDFTLKNRRAVKHIYNSVNRDIFEDYMWRICAYVTETVLRPEFAKHKISDADKRLITRFLTCEVFGLIFGWLSEGMTEDILKDSSRIFALRKGMMEEMLCRCDPTSDKR